MKARVAGLVAGFVLDRAIGDPRRGHPVAVLGRGAARLESALYADRIGRGVLFSAVLVGGGTATSVVTERALRHHPVALAGVTAAATWAALGGRTLGLEASTVHGLLEADDLAGARRRLTHLVGRDTRSLDPDGIARAAVESVAENTSDAVVAPLLWGGVAGVPGLVGYRIANTLDAMVGHHQPRYELFGKASARLDDLLNVVPARLAALLTVVVGGRPAQTLQAWRTYADRHPSPNAGRIESAFAGALGLTLGGRNRYGDTVEDRPELGDGRPPTPDDIPTAVRLADRVDLAALVVAVSLALVPRRRRPRHR